MLNDEVMSVYNINMEKKNNFTDLHFFFRSLLRQTKESENCLMKKKKKTVQR